MGTLSTLDRRLGAAIRRAVDATPRGPQAASLAARAMSPAFRAVVALMITRPATRRAGIEALCASVAAALAARALRDRLARPRPGAREGGGFPSRHAAASTAIATTISHRHPRLGHALGTAAALGMAARIATAEHDPADIGAGVALGLAAAHATTLPTPG